MTQFDGLTIISLIGCLVLAVSSLAAHRLNWQRSFVYLLMWGSIFILVMLVIDAVR